MILLKDLCCQNFICLKKKTALKEALKLLEEKKAFGFLFASEKVGASYAELLNLKNKADLDTPLEELFKDRSQHFSMEDGLEIPFSYMVEKNVDLVAILDKKNTLYTLILSENRGPLAEFIRESAILRKEKEDYISIVSHDLRSPLGVVAACADFLLESKKLESALSKEHRTFVERIINNTDKALSLLEHLLDIGALNKSRSLNCEYVAIKPFLNEISENLSLLSAKKGIKVTADCKDDLYVFLDKQRMTQVLENLVGNAIKFSREGDEVLLRGEFTQVGQGIGARISVIDHGPGLAQEEADKIFTAYHQVDHSKAKSLGVGLGLSIANRYVLSHNGKISVKSKVNKGCAFLVDLPDAKKGAASSQDHDKAPLILCVDDDVDILSYLTESLVERGYRVQEAKNGKEAAQFLRKSKPDLVLSDIQMPEKDGIELLSEAKRIYPDLPFILASGYYQNLAAELSSASSKSDRFLNKPFEMKHLFKAVEDLLKDPLATKKKAG